MPPSDHDGPGRGLTAKQMDLPPGIHPDRILTGEWFGLPYAVDDETVKRIERHQRMLLDGVPQDAPERVTLEEELANRFDGAYADTALDRMALDVASELMQQERPKTAEARAALRQRLKERLQQRLAQRATTVDTKP